MLSMKLKHDVKWTEYVGKMSVDRQTLMFSELVSTYFFALLVLVIAILWMAIIIAKKIKFIKQQSNGVVMRD